MFTSRDFINYFTELESLETNMRDLYKSALEELSDPEVREVFEVLLKAEMKHAEMIDEIRRMAIKKSLNED
jgi:rubrerythrin